MRKCSAYNSAGERMDRARFWRRSRILPQLRGASPPSPRSAMPPKHRRQSALAWSFVALLAGTALSATVALDQYRVLRAERDVQFDRLAERSFDAVQNRLAVCGLLVRSVQSLFLASEELTAVEFERVYGNLRPKEVFPSLQAMAYARRVAIDGRIHYVTDLVAPAAGNERLLGLDLETQPSNLDAVRRAEATDQPAMTAAFLLVQLADQPDQRDGVVIRLPVYSAGPPPRGAAERAQRVRGSLAVSFRISSLIATALPAETLETMQVSIRDLGEPGAPSLFDSRGASEVGGEGARRVRDLHYGGRTWRMELQARPGYAVVPWRQPAAVFLGGLLASFLLAGLIWALMRTRSHALLLAARMSEQYRESEARFRSLNELLPALVLLARGDGTIVYANRAARERLGLAGAEITQSLEDVLGEPGLLAQSALDLVHEATPMVHSVQLAGA